MRLLRVYPLNVLRLYVSKLVLTNLTLNLTFKQFSLRLFAKRDLRLLMLKFNIGKSRQLLALLFQHTLRLAFIFFNKLSPFHMAPKEGLPKYLHSQRLSLDVTRGSGLFVSRRARGAWPRGVACINHERWPGHPTGPDIPGTASRWAGVTRRLARLCCEAKVGARGVAMGPIPAERSASVLLTSK